MIRALYSESRRSFSVNVALTANKEYKLFRQHIVFKFDTGAAATVLSLGALLNTQTIELCRGANIKFGSTDSVKLNSAFGHHTDGYKACIKGVRVAGTFFENFYFYFLPNVLEFTALLGDDVISCCSFTHEPLGHILCDINMACYQKRHEDFEGAIDATKLFTDELKLYR